jgi:hypothetical protein
VSIGWCSGVMLTLPTGGRAVAELGDTPTVVKAGQQQRARVGDPGVLEVATDHEVDVVHVWLVERA